MDLVARLSGRLRFGALGVLLVGQKWSEGEPSGRQPAPRVWFFHAWKRDKLDENPGYAQDPSHVVHLLAALASNMRRSTKLRAIPRLPVDNAQRPDRNHFRNHDVELLITIEEYAIQKYKLNPVSSATQRRLPPSLAPLISPSPINLLDKRDESHLPRPFPPNACTTGHTACPPTPYAFAHTRGGTKAEKPTPMPELTQGQERVSARRKPSAGKPGADVGDTLLA